MERLEKYYSREEAGGNTVAAIPAIGIVRLTSSEEYAYRRPANHSMDCDHKRA